MSNVTQIKLQKRIDKLLVQLAECKKENDNLKAQVKAFGTPNNSNRLSNASANSKTHLAQKLFLDPMFDDFTESAFDYPNTREKAILQKFRQRYYAQESLHNATKRNKHNKRRNRRSTQKNRS